MSYKQLIEGQRYQISAYLSENLSCREIARKMGLNHSTISREVRRNSMSSRDYIPQKAHALALKRRKDSAKSKLSELTVTFVEYCLSHKWSPEQIAGVGKLIGYKVSHEWIYNYIYCDKLRGGSLYRQLRHNGRKYRKGSRSKRVIIPNRVGIEYRPSIVDTKQRLGDWEVDTVLGKQGTGAIVSLVERKSKLYLIRKVKAKSAEEVSDAMIQMLWKHRHYVHTITADNGLEFCDHKAVANALRADVYFANPYASWERGLNENFNVLDDFRREGLAIEAGFSLPTIRVIRTLSQLIEWRGKPSVIRCDNGPEFISHEFTEWARKHSTRIEYIQPGKPQQNAYIERFNRTARYSWVISICSKPWKRFKIMQRSGYGFTIMNGHTKPMAAGRR